MNTALAGALALCALSAVAEGLLSGSNVKSRFAALRLPRYSPPIWAWGLIGLLYYVICFLVLKSLLAQPERGLLWSVTLGSVLAMMAANAAWNYVFFRRKDLYASLTFFVGYDILAIAVFALLVLTDHRFALLFLVYLIYLVYVTIWAYRLWRANPERREAGEQ